jgi:zinc transporter ZupT
MKNKNLIIIMSFLAVLICLIITVLLFYSVPATMLIILTLIIGFISGVCVTLLIHNLINMIRRKKTDSQDN